LAHEESHTIVMVRKVHHHVLRRKEVKVAAAKCATEKKENGASAVRHFEYGSLQNSIGHQGKADRGSVAAEVVVQLKK